MREPTKNYDIIGDIHGHASTLKALLHKLGYVRNENNIYQHETRKVIFLGDFIDRGSEEEQVINIVRPMIDNGYALAVMGNHEFNAICYHTNHPETGLPLRKHNKGNDGHDAFLKDYPLNSAKTKDVIEWFKTLPLYLELDDIRVIHACWNDEALKSIQPLLNPNNTLPDKLYYEASDTKGPVYKAIETLIKGLELKLPNEAFIIDKGGNKRKNIRIKWWLEGAVTYRDYAQVPQRQLQNIPDTKLPSDISDPAYCVNNKPVFIGHYWMTGKPEILSNNIACLDYSVANKEKLVCYRWNDGDVSLSDSQLVCVDYVENN